MKKFLFLVIVVMMIPVFAYSQSITVTNPQSGDVWYKGNSAGYVIRWTKSGTMNPNVKIRLYRGEERVVAIVDSTPNDGEYRWVIPSDVGEGTYKIRVKTVDNEVFDDSEEFVIREGSPPEDSARIVVTSPQSGDVWHKGSSAGYVIRWTKSGTMNPNVKIRLYRGEERVVAIVDSTPNDGEYRWVIPSDVGEGTYKIRVKTVDNEVFDDSETFRVTNRTTLPHDEMVGLKDFELKDIGFTFARGGWITAKIKNRISPFRGDLKFKVVVLKRRPETFYVTKSLDMRADEEKTIRLLQKDRLGEINSCGKIVRVDIDPDNRFRETNEGNNFIGKLIHPKVVDLSIEISDFHWKRVFFRPSHKWRVMFKIHVKADGEGFDSLSNVKVRWSVHGDEGVVYSYDYAPITLNRGESRVLEVSKIFGDPSKRHSVRPRLREGTIYDINVRISRDRTCDSNDRNNLDSQGFRVTSRHR